MFRGWPKLLFFFLLTSILVVSFFVVPRLATPEDVEEEAPKHANPASLRVLAVGSLPAFKFRALPNGGRVQLPTPEGELPPRFVTIPVSKKEAEFLPLKLGRFTPQIKIDEGISVVQLFEGKVVGRQAWKEAELQPGSTSLLLLTRKKDVAKPTWENVNALVIPDGKVLFPEKTLRLVNVSEKKIVVRFDKGKAFSIPSKSSEVRVMNADSVNFAAGVYLKDQKIKLIYKNEIEIEKGTRSTVVFYNEDRQNAPLGQVLLRLFSEKVPLGTGLVDECVHGCDDSAS